VRSSRHFPRKCPTLPTSTASLNRPAKRSIATGTKRENVCLGNLVAGVAHEINNPVGFLQGNIQPAREYASDLLGLIDLLLEQFPNRDEEVEEEIEAVDLDFVREDLPKLLSSMLVGVERIRSISNSLGVA